MDRRERKVREGLGRWKCILNVEEDNNNAMFGEGRYGLGEGEFVATCQSWIHFFLWGRTRGDVSILFMRAFKKEKDRVGGRAG